MPTLSVENYLGLLKRSGLIAEEKLLRALTEFKAETGTPAEKAPAIQLAKFLIQRELLTPWQNEYLFQGKHKGFFLGKYKLMKLLGTGGMGAVFLAEHTLMCRRVAIKVLPTSRVKDQHKLKQFLDEARAIASLDHPNIIQAYNVDCQDSLYYLVMEYVEGHDLEHHVREKGPLSYAQAVEFLRQAADGLAHAHGRKMVHRDIKPSNLLLDKQGTIKILDLGLALLTGKEGDGPADDENSAAWSVGTNVAGTMDYLSPEQAMGAEPDARGDLYSLGCTLYFLLIGAPPFPSKTMHELLLKHQSQEPEPLAELRPDIPEDLVAICAKLMAKQPADRFASAAELAATLDDWLDDHGVDIPARDTRRQRTTTIIARPKSPARQREAQVDDAPTWTSKDSEDTTEVWGPPRKADGLPIAWIGGGIVAALLLLAVMWMALRGSAGPHSRETAGPKHDEKRRKFVDSNIKWNETPPVQPPVQPPVEPPVQPPVQPPAAPVFKLAPGKFGAALLCDGGVYPKFPHDAKWEPEQMTVEAWVWLNELPLPQPNEIRRWFVNKTLHEQHNGHWGLMVFGAKPGAYMNIDGETRLESEADLFQPKVWQHVAFTYDGNELKVYFQGDQVAVKGIGKKRTTGGGDLAIGRRADDYDPMQGMIDEVRIYNRPLSAEEIKSHAQQPNQDARPAKIDEGLISHWGFEEPQPAAAYSPQKRALYKLFEDEPDILSRLNEGDGKLLLDTFDKHVGLASCRVTPGQRFQQSLPGLNLPIRENPQLGEFRYIRFAWKKRAGASTTLQLALDGNWAHRYHAGGGSAFGPSTQVAPDIPSEWTVVTRDLFQDFGQFGLTGFAFSPTDGEYGWFDSVYVARSMADFDQIDAGLIADYGDWSQAPLSIACGRKDGEVLRQDDGYGYEPLQADKFDGWPASVPRSYCWFHGTELKFKVKVPAGMVGTLRLFFVDGELTKRKQRVLVEGREIAEIEAFGAGQMFALPISATDTADGAIEVSAPRVGEINAVISNFEFLPKK